jgi:hypothetical protein
MDALLIDYSRLLNKYFPQTKHIDYLQLDIDPPQNTYEVLLSIPFNEYSFSVITYEHDYYIDTTKSYRDKSRQYLSSLGYKVIAPNVSPNDNSPFEDWWINPNLVCENIWTESCSNTINPIEKLFLNYQ